MNRIVIIRIRGPNGVKPKIRKTLEIMNLRTKFSCVVVKDTPNNLGMINISKDYITWGELDKGMFRTLLEVRGRLPGNKRLSEEYVKEKLKLSYDQFVEAFVEGKNELKDIEGLKRVFKLSPPRGGLERKGSKKHFSMGGAIGYRKEKINDLLGKMI
tara:strand:- start:115 stop:585 length:471 start_codon:yes stop_codon:yes gene_type:complete